ncbi:MAG: helix-turn-helix domain-containing protein [Desulfobacterales bacterium]|nr:helix-turn-helix domain-containing protein [Desulfobacterales bacterium]
MNKSSNNLWPRWLKISAACQYASLSPKTIKRMLIEGQLRGDRTPGGHWRVDRESIDEYFEGDKKAVAIVRNLCL